MPNEAQESVSTIAFRETLRRLRLEYAAESGLGGDVIDGVLSQSIPSAIETPPPAPRPARPARRTRQQRRTQSKCSRCGSTANQPRCLRCNCGEHCCGCRCKRCANCEGGRFAPGHFCQFCEKCDRLCVCRKRKGYFNLNTITSTHHINTLRRHLGLELEIGEWGSLPSGSPVKTTSFSYRTTGDSSVKPSGREMVVNPLIGDGFLTGVVELGKLLHDNDCVVNKSCGFHCHVNAQDLNWWSLRRLLRLWLKVEHGVYNHIIAKHRTNNRYCHRKRLLLGDLSEKMAGAKSASDIKNTMLQSAYGIDFAGENSLGNYRNYTSQQKGQHWNQTKSSKYGSDTRYWGLNIHTYFYRGTVEFRMFEGTTDLGDLMYWPLLCGWLVDAASSLNDKQVEQVTDLLAFSRLYCPAPVAEWVEGKYKANNNNIPEQPITDELTNDDEGDND